LTHDPVVIVREILALAGAMDTDALAGYLHDDVVMELPFAPPPMRRRYEGKAAVVDFQRRAAATFASFTMTIDAVHATDGQVIVAEHSSVGTAATTGREYRNRYVTVFEIDDEGLVRLWREYYNPDAVRAAFF